MLGRIARLVEDGRRLILDAVLDCCVCIVQAHFAVLRELTEQAVLALRKALCGLLRRHPGLAARDIGRVTALNGLKVIGEDQIARLSEAERRRRRKLQLLASFAEEFGVRLRKVDLTARRLAHAAHDQLRWHGEQNTNVPRT